MDNFDVTPLQLNDVLHQFGGEDLNYTALKQHNYTNKFKDILKWISVSIQKVVLWVMFLYVPVFLVLLYFTLITFNSLFSLYYLLSLFVVILFFTIMNRERDAFK